MAVGDTYVVDVQTQVEQRILVNTFAYEQTVGSDVPNVAQNLAATWNLNRKGAFLGILSPALSLQCIIARRVLPTPSIPGIVNGLVTDVGTDGGDPLPAYSALVIKMITDNVNPVHNGRNYYGGVGEDNTSAGVFDALYTGGVVAMYISTMLATLVAIGPADQEFELRVINRQAGGVPIVPPTTSTVTGMTANTLVFRQRRRLTRQTQVGATVI